MNTSLTSLQKTAFQKQSLPIKNLFLSINLIDVKLHFNFCNVISFYSITESKQNSCFILLKMTSSKYQVISLLPDVA